MERKYKHMVGLRLIDTNSRGVHQKMHSELAGLNKVVVRRAVADESGKGFYFVEDTAYFASIEEATPRIKELFLDEKTEELWVGHQLDNEKPVLTVLEPLILRRKCSPSMERPPGTTVYTYVFNAG
ncbi:hypothetical protein KW786_01440 [Candidatus Parcubacteria bacterium]|nr:hypothetical protein [Candidatus Parcubacteria bacterium]